MLKLSNATRDPEDFSHFDLLNNQVVEDSV